MKIAVHACPSVCTQGSHPGILYMLTRITRGPLVFPLEETVAASILGSKAVPEPGLILARLRIDLVTDSS